VANNKPPDAGPGSDGAPPASLDPMNGAPRWRKVLSTTGDDRSFAVTYGRNGDVYALVNMVSPYHFGVPVIGAANYAAVVLRIAP
jgi:hypothetical protein